MKNKFKLIFTRITAIVLSIVMISAFNLTVYSSTIKLKYSVNEAIDRTSKYMLENVYNFGGTWSVIGLSRSNIYVKKEYYEKYYEDLKSLLIENEGVLSKRKYTDYSSVVIALTAMGKDPSNVVGYNLLAKLSDFDNVVYQGINGAIWALIAIDAGEYDISTVEEIKNITTREKLIDYILSKEIDGGGWSMGESTPDPDITAMALQSLAKYNNIPNVKEAIDRGLTILSNIQNNDGGFESWGTKNSESDAQVIVALCSLGINPALDGRFIKNGNSVLTNIINKFYFESKGGFMHISNTGIDLLATTQGFYALIAYDRFINNKSSLYDMRDVKKSYNEENFLNKEKKDTISIENEFTDIEYDPENRAIKALFSKGIIKGINRKMFMPDEKIKRSQFATIISNALLLEEIKTRDFSDVNDELWFSGYVGAATKMKIILGYPDSTFKPDNYTTRQEAAVIIQRAAKVLGKNVSMDNSEAIDVLSQFVDYVECEEWAKQAMAVCVRNRYISDEGIKIYPKQNITRSEVAGMVYRMLEGK